MNRSTYTDANKRESTLLSIRYAVEFVDFSWYRVTRYAKKEYAYIGMTREAANACRLAKIAQYTRPHSIIDGRQSEFAQETRTSCMATIQATRDHGDAWTCSIQVSEVDVKSVATFPLDPASLFADQNAWDYDEDGAMLTITDAYRFGQSYSFVTVSVGGIEDYNHDYVTFEFKRTETEEQWSPASPSYYDGDVKKYRIDKVLTPGWYIRARYGSVMSAPVQLREN